MKLFWQFPLNQNSFGCPLVDQDRVLVATRRALFCLSLEGQEIWRLILPGATSATPVLMEGRVVALPTEKGDLLFIGPEGGILDRVGLGHACASTPVFHQNRFYFALGGTRLGTAGAIAVVSGQAEPVWRREADHGFPVSPLVTDKLVICRDKEGQVVACHRDNGALAWEITLPSSTPVTPVELNSERLVVGANPLYCVDREGEEVWSKPLPGRSLLSVDNTLLVSTHEGPLVCLSDDGNTIWQTEAPGYQAPAVADGHVWVGHEQGSLRRLSVRTGELLSEWTAPTGPRGQKIISDWGPPVVRGDKLFVVSPHSQILHCLSLRPES